MELHLHRPAPPLAVSPERPFRRSAGSATTTRLTEDPRYEQAPIFLQATHRPPAR